MGILGLTGFIDRNTHLLHRHELKDCSVVIDGNNLFHHLYRSCHILSTFGGDYDVYYQRVVTNLKSFSKCGVRPYVVLDGGYTPDNRKFRKCIDRAKQRIGNVRQAAHRGFCQLTPLLAYDTFLQALNDLKISHVTCQFEADSEIVKLANRLECPVISNDSDFYIFDLSHGFLPMDYMDFNPLFKRNADGTKSQPFLHCQKYHVDDFINSFEGLNRSVLPVFASLLGNDFVPFAANKKMYSEVQVPKVVSKKCHLPNRLKKVMKLLHWLEMRSDCSSSILDQILPYLGSKKKFLLSVEGYFNVVKFEGCDLFHFFSLSEESFEPVAASTFEGYNGASFPAWFLKSICKGEITPATINSAVLHRQIFLCQSEHLPSPSSYHCCEFVRKVIYGILMNSDPVREQGASVEHHEENFADLCELFNAAMGKDANKCENDVVEGMLHWEIKDMTTDEVSGELKSDNVDICDASKDDEDEKEGVSNDDKEGDDDNNENFVSTESDGEREDESEVVHLSVLKQTCFEEYMREGGRLKKFYLEPVLSLGGEKLPSLNEIGQLPMEKRLSILLQTLDVDIAFINAFPGEFSLYPACLRMWLQNANPPVTEHHLDCAVLCPILLHMQLAGKKQRPKNKKMKKLERIGPIQDDFIDVDKICEESKLTQSDKFHKVLDNLDKYHKVKPIFSRKNSFDPEIPHAFSQLQSFMFEVGNLNKVLRFPLPLLRAASLMNGTFLYNFYSDLISRPEPHAFIEAMLLKNSDMHNLFLKLKSAIVKATPNAHFAMLGENVIKRRKRKKGGKKKKTSSCEQVVEEKECSPVEMEAQSDEEEMITISGFDTHNKFSLLSH